MDTLGEILLNEYVEKLRKVFAEYNNPRLNSFFLMVEFFFSQLRVNFPEAKLQSGLKDIYNNRFFIKDPMVQNLFWREQIMFRFQMHGMTKSLFETILKFDKQDDLSYPNTLSEIVDHFIASFKIKSDDDNINSGTVNAIDPQKGNGSFRIPRRLIIEKYNEFQKENACIIDNIKKLPFTMENVRDFFDDDMKHGCVDGVHDLKIETQRIFFSGILNDFNISKMYRNKQAMNQKVTLLWDLFKHTHPSMYNIQERKTPKGTMTREKVRYENLLKIIS